MTTSRRVRWLLFVRNRKDLPQPQLFDKPIRAGDRLGASIQNAVHIDQKTKFHRTRLTSMTAAHCQTESVVTVPVSSHARQIDTHPAVRQNRTYHAALALRGCCGRAIAYRHAACVDGPSGGGHGVAGRLARILRMRKVPSREGGC